MGCGASIPSRVSTVAPVRRPVNDGGIFGVSLEDLALRDNTNVPIFLSECVRKLEQREW